MRVYTSKRVHRRVAGGVAAQAVQPGRLLLLQFAEPRSQVAVGLGRRGQLVHDGSQVAQQAHGNAPVASDLRLGRVGLDELGVGVEDAAVAIAMVQPLAQQQDHVRLPKLAGGAIERPVSVAEAQRMQVVDEAPRLLHGEDRRARGLCQAPRAAPARRSSAPDCPR